MGYPRPPESGVKSTPTPQGAKFAWESAGSGLEVCPEAIYGTQEIDLHTMQRSQRDSLSLSKKTKTTHSSEDAHKRIGHLVLRF